MELIVVSVFVIGYILIALEHRIGINKTATALLTGVICWTLFVIADPPATLLQSEHYHEALTALSIVVKNFEALTPDQVHTAYVTTALGHQLSDIAQILFFLMGAMTIVELIDAHDGFRAITDRIQTHDPKKLLWIICWVTFFLSAVLDNLTTTIVMLSLIRKIIPDKKMRWLFAGMIVIAANAGGAWSPIGDVTTTMLWIGGQISAVAVMKSTILASVVCMLVPLVYLSFTLKGSLGEFQRQETTSAAFQRNLMLVLGVAVLVGVPVFKTLTHLPPYLGMMLGLGIIWVVSELIHPAADDTPKKQFTAADALSRIDMPSVLFFLGILLAVGSLEAMATLQNFAAYLDQEIGDNRVIITLIGMLSAIVDNVPLVAASIGMYSLEQYPMDHMIWQYLAYCAGTGGSILIIGSAAGVAAMGIEKIDFIWYLKKISMLALMGYLGGAAVYLITNASGTAF
jgi:Na+/H+ antiporter NhaD/arsenite permease-like protein